MLQMNWWLALLAFSVLPRHRRGHRHLPQTCAQFVSPHPRPPSPSINAFTQEHISGMTVVQLFNREKRAYDDFEAVNRQHMVAFKDAILAYALYYPGSRNSLDGGHCPRPLARRRWSAEAVRSPWAY